MSRGKGEGSGTRGKEGRSPQQPGGTGERTRPYWAAMHTRSEPTWVSLGELFDRPSAVRGARARSETGDARSVEDGRHTPHERALVGGRGIVGRQDAVRPSSEDAYRD